MSDSEDSGGSGYKPEDTSSEEEDYDDDDADEWAKSTEQYMVDQPEIDDEKPSTSRQVTLNSQKKDIIKKEKSVETDGAGSHYENEPGTDGLIVSIGIDKQQSGTTLEVIGIFGSKCPYPAPKSKGRAYMKDTVEEGPEMEKFVQLLRNRTTLHPIIQSSASGDGAVAVPEKSTPKFQILKAPHDMLQNSLALSSWVNDIRKQVNETPTMFMIQHFLQFFAGSLGSQLEKEFLFWANEKDAFKGPDSPYNYWETAFKHYAQTHPVWKDYSNRRIDNMIEEAGVNALNRVTEVNGLCTKLISLNMAWVKTIEEGLQNTLLFMKKFRVLEAEIESKDKNLDEFCHWGKKNLHEMFTTPYFKISSQDYCNLVDRSKFLENVYEDSLIDVKKQKWTTNDFQKMQQFITDVVVDAEYARYVERYNYLMSRITFDRTNRLQEDAVTQLANQMNTTTPHTYIVYDELGHGIGSKRGNPRVNRKKRVADCEHANTTIERNLQIPLADDTNCNNTIIEVKAQMSIKAKDVQNWLHQNETQLKKLTYETLMEDDRYTDSIDWFKVAKKLTAETGKDRTANDCFLAWKHEANTAVNSKRWFSAEMNELMTIVNNMLEQKGSVNWDSVAAQIGNNRTPYQCFYKYRNKVVQTETMTWDDEKTKKIVDVVRNEGAKWGKAVEATEDPRATKQQIQERWRKICNPMLRHGAFTRVEDALLLLALEKLKGFILKENNFGILISYLPWRFETVWRDRANNLFSTWIVPWTIEEDKLLIQEAEAQTGKKDWTAISKKFSSFKNRKGCLTRYNILSKRIGPRPGQFKSVEEYHEKYSMTRYNVRQYPHLPEILLLLKRVNNEELPCAPFPGLSNEVPPEEIQLRYMLLDYDRDIVKRTIFSLESYISSRDAYWRPWTDQFGELKKTFDRRNFCRTKAQSVASAVHIRGLKMVPKEQISGGPLTQFESDVYTYYGRFCQTKAPNKDIERPSLPTAKKLSKLPEITRIVTLASEHENEESASDWDNEDASEGPPRKRGRPKKDSTSASRKRSRSKNENASPVPRKRGRPRKKIIAEKAGEDVPPGPRKPGRRRKKIIAEETNEDASPGPRKPGRPRKKIIAEEITTHNNNNK